MYVHTKVCKMVILGLRWGRGYDPILKLQGVLLPLSINPLLPLARSPPTPLPPSLPPWLPPLPPLLLPRISMKRGP